MAVNRVIMALIRRSCAAKRWALIIGEGCDGVLVFVALFGAGIVDVAKVT